MSDGVMVESGQPMSQGMRVVNTFVAPSKTFMDILKSANCWLPILLTLIVGVGFSYAVDKKVGFEAVTETRVAQSEMAQERWQQATPVQRAMQVKVTRIISYAFIVPILIFMLIHVLLLWATFNFVLGAQTTFPQVFAVAMFAGLPKMFIYLLSAGLLFAGVGLDNFDMNNPAGTNVGYFLSGSSPAVKVAGSFFDIFGIWSLILLAIGMSIISKKKLGSAAMVVIAWELVGMLLAVGMTALFS